MKTEQPKVLKSTVEDKNVSTNIDHYEKKKKKNKARPFKSEYQLQFREYPLVRPSSDVNAVAPDEAVELKHSYNGKGHYLLLCLKHICHEPDWFTRYNSLYDLSQSTESRLNFHCDENL